MCLNTHIFVLYKPTKTTKNTQMTLKMIQIHKNVFLCDSDTKRLKTSEKWPKFTQITVSVPEVTQNVKTSPWLF